LNERIVQHAEVQRPDMPETERPVLNCLTHDPLHIDELTHQCHLPVAQVSSTLTMLELKGMVRQVAGMTYVRP
jgi:DNA processing protein